MCHVIQKKILSSTSDYSSFTRGGYTIGSHERLEDDFEKTNYDVLNSYKKPYMAPEGHSVAGQRWTNLDYYI